MDTFKQHAIEAALDKLFSMDYFDVTKLDRIGTALNVNVQQHPSYDDLRLLHCVNYRDMNQALIDELQVKILSCLAPRFNNPAQVIARALLFEGNDFLSLEDAS